MEVRFFGQSLIEEEVQELQEFRNYRMRFSILTDEVSLITAPLFRF
jgi:hypothetical protein